MAYHYSRNRNEAEDVAQEALLRAWRRRSSLRDSSRRREWLGTIVRNEAYRIYAKPRPEPVEDLETHRGAEDDNILATVDRADLHAAIRSLNETEQELVRLRYDEDLTQQAIAKRLRIPDGTVKVRLHRVRLKLRDALNGVKRRSVGRPRKPSAGGSDPSHLIGGGSGPDVGDEHGEEQVGE